MRQDEYIRYDATALAALVRSREVTPAELLSAALAAVERVNGKLNAVVAEFAAKADAEIAHGLPEWPFRGVPFLLKDLTAHYGGEPTGSGWAPRLGYPAPADSALVARLKAAGLVIFGKTAVPELAMDWTTRSRPHGITRNPWGLGHTVGTSSGGAAAAVAARVVPMAHGNDGGGSIRVPASCCGCFGLKPTRGRNPAAPSGATWQGMLVEHALTRSVRDSAALLDATAGAVPGQFYNSPAPVRLAGEVGRDPGELSIGVITASPYGAPTHADCLAAVEDTATLLAELGHNCEPAAFDLPQNGWAAFETFILAEYATDMAMEAQILGRPLGPDDFPPMLWQMIEAGRAISGVDLSIATAALHEVARRICALFAHYDVVLTPTLAQPPLPHERFPENVGMEAHYAFYLSWMPYTHVFNVSGSPAMSVPLCWNAEGLPIGVQLAAAPGQEALLIRLSAQLETARPWAGRMPPIHA